MRKNKIVKFMFEQLKQWLGIRVYSVFDIPIDTRSMYRVAYQRLLQIISGENKEKIRQFIKSVQPREANNKLIRLGTTDGDGGYLLPDDLDGIAACFSPGVSGIATFEADCIKRGIPCFLADASIEVPPIQDAMTHFTKKYLGDVSEGRYITLDDWVAESLPNLGSTGGDLLLQMDIEGCEYDTLLAASDHLLRRFRIMIIEFHSLEFVLTNTYGRRSAVFDKILQTHQVVHIHPNTTSNEMCHCGIDFYGTMEFTFARKDIVTSRYSKMFPHPLDRDNVPRGRPHISLPKCWIGSNH